MTNLILAPTRRYYGFGDKNDFCIPDGGRCIGRIFLSPQAPEGRSRSGRSPIGTFPRQSTTKAIVPLARKPWRHLECAGFRVAPLCRLEIECIPDCLGPRGRRRDGLPPEALPQREREVSMMIPVAINWP